MRQFILYRMGGTVGERFATQPNALNLVRLLLAVAVVVHHSLLDFTDTAVPPAPVVQLLTQMPVDAFFAISGFLICRSWMQRPGLLQFVTARASRILPGLCGAVLVTAFVVAPLIAGPTLLEQTRYVVSNVLTAGVVAADSSLGGSMEWNGPLWTLGPEALCYAAVACLGVCGLVRPRIVVAAMVTAWAASLGGVLVAEQFDGGLQLIGVAAPRFALMFATGALLWLLARRIPLRHDLAAFSAFLVAVGALTPCYRLVAAPALAYLCVWLALSLGRFPQLVLRHDFSYGIYIYGWPSQMLLAAAGVNQEGWLVFCTLSLALTAPLAVMSWFAVERPALLLRRWLTGGATEPGGAPGSHETAGVLPHPPGGGVALPVIVSDRQPHVTIRR